MSVIQFSNLTFAYEGSADNVFENASFRMDTDWRLGFVGRNGRGKTTLLNLLMGKYEYSGSLTASVKFDYFPYPVNDLERDTLAVAEEIACGVCTAGDFEIWALKYELSLLEVNEDVLYRPFSTLSHGERTKVLLAALFTKNERFLLIDEPTDHLDEHAREIVAMYLKSKRGFILVSHDRWLLDYCADHILAINRGGVEVQRGNFSSWFQNRRQQDAFELEKNRRVKKEIKRLETTAREKAEWSDRTEASKIGTHVGDRGYVGHMAAKAMKRSKNIENRVNRRLEEKETLLKNIEKADALAVTPLIHHSEWLFELKDVVIRYGDKQVCGPVSFTLRRGGRLALKGRNGSGKSSLIKLCLNHAAQVGSLRSSTNSADLGTVRLSNTEPELRKGSDVESSGLVNINYDGEIRSASRLIISYVSQDTSGLTGSLSDYAALHGLDETLFKSILRKLDFTRAQFEKDMSDFSSGQKKKALLAKSLCERAHVYIWDEPLNFVDVLSRIQIEELILASRPTMLFVEHDRAFTEKIATQVVRL